MRSQWQKMCQAPCNSLHFLLSLPTLLMTGRICQAEYAGTQPNHIPLETPPPNLTNSWKSLRNPPQSVPPLHKMQIESTSSRNTQSCYVWLSGKSDSRSCTVWTITHFLSSLWQLRAQQKRVVLIKSRTDMEASCRLNRSSKSDILNLYY